MAKVSKGRISGFHGMDRHTAAELYAWADVLQLQVSDPANTDDPKWLGRRADRLRQLAAKKAKGARAQEGDATGLELSQQGDSMRDAEQVKHWKVTATLLERARRARLPRI